MRIGMVLDKTFPPDPRVENEAQYLIEKGYELFLFCLTYDAQKVGLEDYRGIKVVRYLSHRLLYKSSAMAYAFPYYKLKMSAKIKEFILSYQIEVLHVHDIQIVSAACRVSKTLKVPYILDLHENRPEIMKFYPHLKRGLGKWLIDTDRWKAAEEKYSSLAERVIVVTEGAKEDLLERTNILSQKIVPVPNTVLKAFYTKYSLEERIAEKFEDDFVLLYIGDTAIRRGLLTVIRALPELKKSIKNIKLVVVGKSTEDYILRAEVDKLSIQHIVSFEGWQHEKLFPSYILTANICISPLHRNKHHDTTYANKLFQYSSLGRPLLVSDSTAQKEWVEKHQVGLSHQAEDIVDFAKQVKTLYRQPSLMDQMGEKGAALIQSDFNWDKTAKGLSEIYQQIKKIR